MALSEPSHTRVLEILGEVDSPLTWNNWMHAMAGVPGMRSGATRNHYMTLKFGAVSYTHLTLPTNREV